jgi:SAM-dependent methyltransferase
MSDAPAFFEAMYQRNIDPWDFATSPYEQLRYRTVIDLLANRQFTSAFEPGCSVGELTALLAPQCQQLLAVDPSATAVSRARERCAAFPQVELRQDLLPAALPTNPIDLAVICEVGYYFTEPDLDFIVDALATQLSMDGLLVSTNWLGDSPDHELHGELVHDRVGSHRHLELVQEGVAGIDDDRFVFGLWVRR